LLAQRTRLPTSARIGFCVIWVCISSSSSSSSSSDSLCISLSDAFFYKTQRTTGGSQSSSRRMWCTPTMAWILLGHCLPSARGLSFARSSASLISRHAPRAQLSVSRAVEPAIGLAADLKGQWRPTVDDVVRISWGKPAKRKGTGSRGVPHRLNEDERRAFDTAVRKGFLESAGSGWRKERRDSPLLNTYRSFCDAKVRKFCPSTSSPFFVLGLE
jgi:hypothetical protein